jgi:hypothetical protein
MAFVLFVNLSFAQAFAPIGAEWHYTERFAFSGDVDYLTIKSIKDTTINGKPSRKLDCDWLCWNPSGIQYIHYSNDSLYHYNSDLNKFQLIAAFNAQKGDTWDILMKDWDDSIDTLRVLVDSINIVTINQKPLRQLFVTYNLKGVQNYSYPSRIIEKIGDVYYLFNFPLNANLICDANYSQGLRCYEDSELGFYSTGIADSCTYIWISNNIEHKSVDDMLEVFPNPTHGMLEINTTKEISITATIEDLSGKRVMFKKLNPDNLLDISGLPNGIYILTIYDKDNQIGSTKILKN